MQAVTAFYRKYSYTFGGSGGTTHSDSLHRVNLTAHITNVKQALCPCLMDKALGYVFTSTAYRICLHSGYCNNLQAAGSPKKIKLFIGIA